MNNTSQYNITLLWYVHVYSKRPVHNFDLQYKGKGGLSNLMRKRLTSAPRRAINVWSKVADQKKAEKLYYKI